MKRISLLLVLVIVLLAAVVLGTRPVEAHQTDTPHLRSYSCAISGSDLLCKIKIHNPAWWGSFCTHIVESSYLRKQMPFAAAEGCDIWAWFRPIPPQGSQFASLVLRNWWDNSVVSTHDLSWGATVHPTPVPPTQDPHFTGYECDWQSLYHCLAWMYIPATYTSTYYGTVESADFLWGGSSYDPGTRTWTLEMYFAQGVACGQFARLYAVETPSGRLLDEMYMERDCP